MKTKSLAMCFAAFALALCLTGCSVGKEKLDMKELMKISYTGLDGRAKIATDFDYDAVLGPMPDYSASEFDSYAIKHQALEKGIVCVEYSSHENLSNGDKINISVHYNEDLLAENGYAVKNAEWTEKVSGLSAGEHINVFDYLNVEFEGVDGDARCVLSCNEPASNFVTYRLSDVSMAVNGKLTTGDKITVDAITDSGIAAEYGYLVDDGTQEYTVSGTYHAYKPQELIDSRIIKAGWNAVLEKYNWDSEAGPVKVYQAYANNEAVRKVYRGNYMFSPASEILYVFKDAGSGDYCGVLVMDLIVNGDYDEIVDCRITQGMAAFNSGNIRGSSVEALYDNVTADAHLYHDENAAENDWYFREVEWDSEA